MANLEKDNPNIVVVDSIYPMSLPIIPIKVRPVFPHMVFPLAITSKKSKKAVEAAFEKDGYIGLNLLKDDDLIDYKEEDIYRVGCLAKIMRKVVMPDGNINIFLNTLSRMEIKRFVTFDPYIIADVDYIDDSYNPKKNDKETHEIMALTRAVISEVKEIAKNNPLFSEDLKISINNINDPNRIADYTASILNIKKEDLQEILETYNIRERLKKVLVHLQKEKYLTEIQKKIQEEINAKITKQQRDFFLREELKAIKKELGIDINKKEADYQKFKKIIEGLKLTEEAREKVNEELEKLERIDEHSPEYAVIRNYLDLFVSLPWNDDEEEDIDIDRAEMILNKDHWGLEDVKRRIIEFIAVRKLKKGSKGSIICFVGPPGTGKTSVGKSIARALNKKFFRFALGGMRDEAEIKGHRRTYIGAMPGKIIMGLKVTKSKSPVFMLDEIDKLGSSFQGDPASALLEVLDPEQNTEFRDNYLDVPFDLSNVLFITTANTIDTIPLPLLDRMEIITLSGYILEEKLQIAKRYLIPKILDRNGIKRSKIRFTKAALKEIIDGYCREAGVRSLEKSIEKIVRQIAYKMVKGQIDKAKVDKDDIEGYLKRRIFDDTFMKQINKPGISTGLAWTRLGGSVLHIESIYVPDNKGGLKLTGKLGDVMQESANIAYSYVRSVVYDYIDLDKTFFANHQIHLHVPAGATPKDGPSAGITMAISMFSLLVGKSIKKKLAMTGELSLTGNVLPVGGIKEKVIAAKRNGIKEIILPKQNEKDLDDIPDYVKVGIKFHPVEYMDEVIRLSFDKI